MGVLLSPPPPPPRRDPLEEPDWLELEFRKLEAEVRARECEHERRVDLSALGVAGNTWLCVTCNRRWTEEP